MATRKKAAEDEAAVQAEEVKVEEAAETTEAKDPAETTEAAAPEAESQEEDELSPTARTYQRYYQKGFWNKKMLKNMVKKGKITAREYEIITGEAY